MQTKPADGDLENALRGSFNERIRDWKSNGFRLELYDTGTTDKYGKSVLAYRFFDERYGNEPIFTGADFACSPMHATDSDATVASLLSFLSLRPGDTDADYFSEYTTTQLDWVGDRGEELAYQAFMLGENN